MDLIYSDEANAFQNFFHDYQKRKQNGEQIAEWGPEYWKPWGVDVLDSKIVFYTAKHRTLFLLRWR